MLFISFYPAYKIFELSLFETDIFSKDKTFVGLENIVFVLSSARFWRAIGQDVIFTGSSIIFQTLLGLAIALLLNKKFFGRSAIRSLILFSYLLPIVVSALIWKFILNDTVGIVDQVVSKLPINIQTTWFASPKTAMPTVILVSVWKFFPFMVIVFLAQLQSIDPFLYEASKIDGASSLQQFFYITLPMLLPVMIVAAMMRTIWHFNNFSLINLLTGGGPLASTQTPPLLIYDVIFYQYKLGRGSAIAFIMLIILLTASFFYFRLYNWAQKRL
jgi:multiple sugar transport system permease protein